MKSIAVIMIATVFGVLGTAPAHAQTPPATSIPGTPELCVEADTRPPNVDCDNVFPGEPNPYPPAVAPPTTTIPAETTTTTQPPAVAPPTTVPPVLPSTGSSGTSGLLQIGALMLTGGLLIVVATRRRSTVRPTTA